MALMSWLCWTVQGGTHEPYQKNSRPRLSNLHTKMEVVSKALENGQCSKVGKKSGMIDMQVARFFVECIESERGHPELTNYADALALSKRFEKWLEPITSNLGMAVTHAVGGHVFGVIYRQSITLLG